MKDSWIDNWAALALVPMFCLGMLLGRGQERPVPKPSPAPTPPILSKVDLWLDLSLRTIDKPAGVGLYRRVPLYCVSYTQAPQAASEAIADSSPLLDTEPKCEPTLKGALNDFLAEKNW
jgi:hypothetical protein